MPDLSSAFSLCGRGPASFIIDRAVAGQLPAEMFTSTSAISGHRASTFDEELLLES